MSNFLSKCQCHSTQHCLLSVLGKWKLAIDNGNKFELLLTNLSKVFDGRSYELLLTKLHAYSFCCTKIRT